MINDNDKYQNILAQIHELNRQNLLNENEKMEQISFKIEELSKELKNTNKSANSNKIGIIAIILTLINTMLIAFLIFTNIDNLILNNKDIKLTEKKKEKVIKEKIIDEVKKEDNSEVLSFNVKAIDAFEEENFEDIKPIIRKGTLYTCKEDKRTYKIPYTVEIKGKLYSDRFTFILQENNQTKDCSIKKENM